MIEDIFQHLKQNGVVRSSFDFSTDWLGMEGSYMRCLRFKGNKPSERALARCAKRLRKHGSILSQSDMLAVQQKAVQFNRLADLCVQAIFDRSEISK